MFTPPDKDPAGWRHAVAEQRHLTPRPAGTVAMLRLPSPGASIPAFVEGIRRLCDATLQPLGHVSLGYAARPIPEVLDDLARWAGLGVSGVFLDHAPTGPAQLNLVRQTIRAAHHSGLTEIVLNPGGPVDPAYRRLDVTICSFEGSWSDYLTWSAEEAMNGDGHLVFGVPRQELAVARALVLARGAGLYLVAEQADAYSASTRRPPSDPVHAGR